MSTSDSIIEKKISDISGWADKQKSAGFLADVKFCPHSLEAGDVNDYIEDAYTMIKDYSKGNYEDCTNIIL